MAAAGIATPTRDERIGIAATATAGFGVAAVAARDLAGLHLLCPLRALTGVPCPGCGMTSVASSLASGDVAGALTADPAGVLLVAVVATLSVVHAGGQRVPAIARAAPADRTLVVMAAVALGVHWATTLLTGGALTA